MRLVRRARRATRRWVETGLDRFRTRGRASLAWTFRLTAATVISYGVADLVFANGVPLLAPLTALLVVQLTPVSILTSGIQRVVSVVAGVLIAVAFSSLVGLTWWSLGIAVAVSLLLGQVLRLGQNQVEVPISAMLVLGVAGATATAAAWQRVAETLVGAGVGVMANLVFPPRVSTKTAADAIDGLADSLARLVEQAAVELLDATHTPEELSELTRQWLGDARRITHDMPNVGTALIRAEESRKLNIRALGQADTRPGLRQGTEALEHSAVALRSMFRGFVEATQAYESVGREFALDVRAAINLLLLALAASLQSFGRLVSAEAMPGDTAVVRAEHEHTLQELRGARAEVADLLLVDPRSDVALAGLTFFLIAAVDRILTELDLETRIRYRERRLPVWTSRLRRRSGHGGAPEPQ